MSTGTRTAAARPFVDTNVLLYLLSADTAKADRAEALLAQGATIGVQVLNEFVSVARRKLGMPWEEVSDVLGLIRHRCTVRSLTPAVHDLALSIAPRYGFAWYDALIVAAALDGGCRNLYTEDMHDRLEVTSAAGSKVVIRNPFLAA
jgi:predicted nucleic acid-binding protein